MNSSDKGSKFDLDFANRIFKFTLWGLWEEQHLKAWQQGFRENLQKFGEGEFYVYVDMSNFPPQRPEITKGMQEMMALAMKSGMTKASHLVSRTMTELQIKRLSDEVGAPNFRFFGSEEEAMNYLLPK